MTSTSFDPAAWLTDFTRAGGSYALTGDGRLWLGIVDMPAPLDEHTLPLMGRPERVEAIKALVKERCLIG